MHDFCFYWIKLPLSWPTMFSSILFSPLSCPAEEGSDGVSSWAPDQGQPMTSAKRSVMQKQGKFFLLCFPRWYLFLFLLHHQTTTFDPSIQKHNSYTPISGSSYGTSVTIRINWTFLLRTSDGSWIRNGLSTNWNVQYFLLCIRCFPVGIDYFINCSSLQAVAGFFLMFTLCSSSFSFLASDNYRFWVYS